MLNIYMVLSLYLSDRFSLYFFLLPTKDADLYVEAELGDTVENIKGKIKHLFYDVCNLLLCMWH